MKNKVFVSALLIAAFAALGLSRGVLAGPGGATSSDPNCKPLDSNTSNEIILCTESMTVEIQKSGTMYVTVEAVPSENTLPFPPKVKFLGPATTISIVDAKGLPVKATFMQICFKDNTKANIFRWWTPEDFKTWYNVKAAGRWVYTETTHTSKGMSCTSNWLPGIFTIN